MELWIRSQDKERIIKTNQLDVMELDTDVDPRYNHFGLYANEYLVGEYKTKERALEVLDEIQNILNPMIVFKNCECTEDILDNIKELGACCVRDNAHIEQLSTCVYEMPKE